MAVQAPDLAPAVLGRGGDRRLRLRLRVAGLDLWLPALVLAVIVGACVFGPLFGALPDPNAQDLSQAGASLVAPGHLLGTDALGRDLLARCLYGGRISLLVGVGAVALGAVVGGSLGVLAGYLRGVTDTVISRFVDMLLAFPALVLAIVVATYLGPSVRNVILAVGFFTVPAFVRLSRATALSVRERDSVLAAKLAGARPGYVIVRHVVPNVLASLLSYGLLMIGTAMILEASLSFLGLGVQPPAASWGSIISAGKADIADAPHIALVPGAFLFATVVVLNLAADAIQVRLDRRMRQG